MNTEVSKPMSAEMAADIQRWMEKSNEKSTLSKETPFEETRQQMIDALANAPENPVIPYHLTEEGMRWAKFKVVCDEAFHVKIDYSLIKDREAFDKVANWDGAFPGPCASGPTDSAKTRASWQALRKLYVRENKSFAWFPVRRLITELSKYEENKASDEFFRTYDFFKILFVDDLDKINWDYNSAKEQLFAFFDWVYRKKKPCIVTTNNNRAWWANKMGDAFARRLFSDACKEVAFK